MGEAKRRQRLDPSYGLNRFENIKSNMSYAEFLSEIERLSHDKKRLSKFIGDRKNYSLFLELMQKEIIPKMSKEDGVEYEIYFDEELKENSVRLKQS